MKYTKNIYLDVTAFLWTIFYPLQQKVEKYESKFIAQKAKYNFGLQTKKDQRDIKSRKT